MGQYFRLVLVTIFLLVLAGCDRASPSAQPATAPGEVRIVSLTPAGSDMIITMGLAEKLVGISAYDNNQRVQKLPKVGDYMRIDWEQIALIKPTHLFLQGKRDRLPPGIEEHCRDLNISANILQIDQLVDIYTAIDQIGNAVGETEKSSKAIKQLKQKLPQVPGRPVPALILIGAEGKSLVGKATYVNDLLELAGGTNVIDTMGYIVIDQEKAATLKPEVVFVLASKSQSGEANSLTISSDHWPAIKNKRVFTIYDDEALLPATCVTKVYDFFTRHLSSAGATTQP